MKMFLFVAFTRPVICLRYPSCDVIVADLLTLATMLATIPPTAVRDATINRS